MSPMTIPHDAAHHAGWTLARGEVLRLTAERRPRLLLVLCGQVWITEQLDGRAGRQAVDHWLAAGQTLALPGGTRWIAEARQGARMVLLQPPPARRAGAGGPGWLRALRRVWPALGGRLAAAAGPRAA